MELLLMETDRSGGTSLILLERVRAVELVRGDFAAGTFQAF
jgi:hypothetical protein